MTKETGTEVDLLIDLLSLRRDRFGLIAEVFTSESPEEIVAQTIAYACDQDDDLGESIESILKMNLRSIEHDDLHAFATETRTEFARLFIGPRKVIAPLHESAYLSGTARMFTSETLAVRKFYSEFGYVMKRKNKEPEDSVGVETEFLRNICDRCAALLTGDSSSQTLEEAGGLMKALHMFEAQHLKLWAYDFADRVMENDRSGYYAVWAAYLVDILHAEDGLTDRCEELLDDIRCSRQRLSQQA